jgi:hypothetical protein
MSLAAVALASVLASGSAPQASAAPELLPITVKVEVAEKAGPDLSGWAAELRTALAARKEEFRLAKAGAKPELVVRLDGVTPVEGANNGTVKGALVRGSETRPFTYTFANVRADAEKLARNLRRLADQMEAAKK